MKYGGRLFLCKMAELWMLLQTMKSSHPPLKCIILTEYDNGISMFGETCLTTAVKLF